MKKTVLILLILLATSVCFTMTPYEEGYKKGYDLGFCKGYEKGYEKGSIAGSTKGKDDGTKQGRHFVLKLYIEFSYGPSIEKYSDKNIHIRPKSIGRGTWEDGYDLGYREGKTAGYKSGYDQGKSIEYRNAFRKAYLETEKKTHTQLYYKNGYKMTDKEQFEYALDCHQGGNYRYARTHFNLILRDFPDSQFVKQALWWGARTNLAMNKKIDAAVIYMSLVDNFQSLREKAALECSKILITLKTQSQTGQPQNTYYKKAINCTNIVIKEYPDSELVPEAMYIKGLCYEQLNDIETSKAVFLAIILRYPTSPFAEKARFFLRTR